MKKQSENTITFDLIERYLSKCRVFGFHSYLCHSVTIKPYLGARPLNRLTNSNKERYYDEDSKFGHAHHSNKTKKVLVWNLQKLVLISHLIPGPMKCLTLQSVPFYRSGCDDRVRQPLEYFFMKCDECGQHTIRIQCLRFEGVGGANESYLLKVSWRSCWDDAKLNMQYPWGIVAAMLGLTSKTGWDMIGSKVPKNGYAYLKITRAKWKLKHETVMMILRGTGNYFCNKYYLKEQYRDGFV